MQNTVSESILSISEITELVNNVDVQFNKQKLLTENVTENVVKFSISLPNEIKTKLETSLSIQLSNSVPMRWIKGDTLPHIDKGESHFERTYLIYLTDSSGSLIVDTVEYPIVGGNAHIFSEGLEHSTINTGDNERLMIGPMSEYGFGVGNGIIYYSSKSDAEQQINAITGVGNFTLLSFNGITAWTISSSIGSPSTPNGGPHYVGEQLIEGPTYFVYPYSLISNICFPKDTPIVTDQGIVHIQDIKNNTINGVKIEHVTKTISIYDYLVCFEKDSLSMNYPSDKTIMTPNHKILHNGTMTDAYHLLDSNKIYKIPYNGEILYNVLLEQNGLMQVNGLICETLDVNNVIALLYKSNYTLEEKNNIIKLMNETIYTDYDKYKDISRKYLHNV